MPLHLRLDRLGRRTADELTLLETFERRSVNFIPRTMPLIEPRLVQDCRYAPIPMITGSSDLAFYQI
ncbi:MAG TPA: hypothetical protein VE954_11430 [Oligoflexus sp.]|uniref:hypothetical protein n=1 Tax=Oligoflexus sp. TaxID=1971216 RepID=UPI002D375C5D|nr:hypothetical protein [Oligoflexus sp.]HYX33716.1 hypothetical protein [Oligoflexus sp.]